MTGRPASHTLGSAHERTRLAWQRTALAIVAAAAIMVRLTWASLGVAAIAPLLAALGLSGWVFFEGSQRDKASPRSGRASLFLTIATALIAVTELITLASS